MRFGKTRRARCAAWTTLLFAAPLSAADAPADWGAIARRDIAEMNAVVREAYVGYVDPQHPEVAKRWDAAIAEAQGSTEHIASRADWAFVLRRLANTLRDSHVSVRFPSPSTEPIAWTGYAVELIGSRYWLRPVESPQSGRTGGEIIECDDVPIAELAERRLDLNVVDWSVLANRSLAAPRLLIDQGIALLPRIEQCDIRTADGEQRVIFEWRTAPRTAVLDAIRPYARRRPQGTTFTLQFLDDGSAWLTVPTFADSVGNAALREQLSAAIDRVRAASHIVFDVRGNSGGNSELGTRLAELLYGEGTLVPAPAPQRAKTWRASERLVSSFEAARRSNANNPELQGFIDRRLPLITEAVAAGRPLVRDPDASITDPVAPSRKTALKAPVFVLTDGGCASSCVMFVDELKRMGAVQVGEPTDRNALYAEQWVTAPLPSGEAQLAVSNAWFGWSARELGGGLPDLVWQGDAADDAGLRKLIAAEAKRRSKPAR